MDKLSINENQRFSRIQKRIKELEKLKKQSVSTFNQELIDKNIEGIKFARDEILKIIKDCKFDKNNIAIKEFKKVIEKEIVGEPSAKIK